MVVLLFNKQLREIPCGVKKITLQTNLWLSLSKVRHILIQLDEISGGKKR